MVERTCAACAVARMYAPPAIILPQPPHFQMPTTERFVESFPQKTQVYFECWLTSIFLTTLRSDEPYRTPYFPVIPAFFVRLFTCGGRENKSESACGPRWGRGHGSRGAFLRGVDAEASVGWEGGKGAVGGCEGPRSRAP